METIKVNEQMLAEKDWENGLKEQGSLAQKRRNKQDNLLSLH